MRSIPYEIIKENNWLLTKIKNFIIFENLFKMPSILQKWTMVSMVLFSPYFYVDHHKITVGAQALPLI